jgi:carbonic anhydrase
VLYAVGYVCDAEGSNELFQRDGENTFTELLAILQRDIAIGALLIAFASLAFLIWWDKNKPKQGPLVVAVLVNTSQGALAPALLVPADQLVRLQVTSGLNELAGLLRFPDIGPIGNSAVWTRALTLAIVASLESLLSIKAVDKIDRMRRVTCKNCKMRAQGVGNFGSGPVGGLPVTSVIVAHRPMSRWGRIPGSRRSCMGYVCCWPWCWYPRSSILSRFPHSRLS